jgi:hypothetical protein
MTMWCPGRSPLHANGPETVTERNTLRSMVTGCPCGLRGGGNFISVAVLSAIVPDCALLREVLVQDHLIDARCAMRPFGFATML